MNEDRHEELARKLAAIEAPSPPEGLLDKLRDDIPLEFPVENRSRVKQFTGWSLGLAASLIMMIGAAWFAMQYQKAPAFDVAPPVSQPIRSSDESLTAATASVTDTLQAYTPEPQATSPVAKGRTKSTAAETDLRKQNPADKDDAPAPPPPPAPAQPASAYAPETPPPAIADSSELRVEAPVEEGAIVGAAAGAERLDVAANERVAAQRAEKKSAGSTSAAPSAPSARSMQMTAKTEAVAPIRIAGDVPAPRLLRRVEPVISREARRANVRGLVIVDAVIDTSGNVVGTRLVKGQPFGLNEAVADAVRQWKFEPTVVDGRAVAVIYEVAVRIGRPE